MDSTFSLYRQPQAGLGNRPVRLLSVRNEGDLSVQGKRSVDRGRPVQHKAGGSRLRRVSLTRVDPNMLTENTTGVPHSSRAFRELGLPTVTYGEAGQTRIDYKTYDVHKASEFPFTTNRNDAIKEITIVRVPAD